MIVIEDNFSVNTDLGLNVKGGYVLSIGHLYTNPGDNIFNFNLNQYDLKYINAYKLGDNCLILDEVKKQELINKEKEVDIKERISELKKLLSDTDYIWCKIQEGVSTKEDYADVIEQRKKWREEVEELEKLVV